MTDAYTVLFLLAIAVFVFAILGVNINIYGKKIRVDDVSSAFAAQQLIHAASRAIHLGAGRRHPGFMCAHGALATPTALTLCLSFEASMIGMPGSAMGRAHTHHYYYSRHERQEATSKMA